MNFSIDRLLQPPPMKLSPVCVPQLSLEQYCKYWLATAYMPTVSGCSIIPAPFHSTTYSSYPKSSCTLSPVAHERECLRTPSCSESGAESDCERPQHRLSRRKIPTGQASKKKTRTIFTSEQLQDLEKHFNGQKYLSKVNRCKLACQLGLQERQVKTWYQNRRTRWKKECSDQEWSKEKELSAANNYTQYVLEKSQTKSDWTLISLTLTVHFLYSSQ